MRVELAEQFLDVLDESDESIVMIKAKNPITTAKIKILGVGGSNSVGKKFQVP